MTTYSYLSKQGSMSFQRKLAKMIAKRHIEHARYLLQQHESKFGKSQWNPAYGIFKEAGAQCAYTNIPLGH